MINDYPTAFEHQNNVEYPHIERDHDSVKWSFNVNVIRITQINSMDSPPVTSAMSFPYLLSLALVTSLFRDVTTLKRCGIVEATPDPTYHLIKPCSRSKMTLVGSANTKTLQQCQRYATAKKALALNYNPSGDFQEEPSCLLFDCPEFQEEISLAEDDVYDYYSLYADPMPDSNVSCIPKVGMFKLHPEKTNFTAAQDICVDEGGYLANVLSEQKTNALSDLIASMYAGRGKHLVYVGLTDTEMEGQYVNMKDEPMDCFNWRAWAPNQPRSKYKTEDCVVLTTDKNWRVVNCSLPMPFLCELAPRGPYNLCEEEPQYCGLTDGSPAIPTGPVEPPNSQPDDHLGTDIPDIIEIPLPGTSGVNSTEPELQIIDINNISDSNNPNNKEQNPTRDPQGKIPGDKKPGDTSRKPESQGNVLNEKPLSENNEGSPGLPSNFGSFNSENKPGSSESGNQWDSLKPGSNRTGNQWRPSLGPNSDNPDDNNWKPNHMMETANKPDKNGWRPVLNPNTINGNSTKRPFSQNSWSAQSTGNSGNKNILWRPQNTVVKDPKPNHEQGLWITHNTNIDWAFPNGEHPQEGNNYLRPQSQNNYQNTWRPQNSGNEYDQGNSISRPHSPDSNNPQENNSWIPGNVGTQEKEQANGWKPQTPNDHQNPSDQSSWNPATENNGNENSNKHQQGWKPQSTETHNYNENRWKPSNGGTNGQYECSDWAPNGNDEPSSAPEDQWTPTDQGEDHNIRDCNLNEWVPQERDPKNIRKENKNPKNPTEEEAGNAANGDGITEVHAINSVNSKKHKNKTKFQNNGNNDFIPQGNPADIPLKELKNLYTQELKDIIAVEADAGSSKDDLIKSTAIKSLNSDKTVIVSNTEQTKRNNNESLQTNPNDPNTNIQNPHLFKAEINNGSTRNSKKKLFSSYEKSKEEAPNQNANEKLDHTKPTRRTSRQNTYQYDSTIVDHELKESSSIEERFSITAETAASKKTYRKIKEPTSTEIKNKVKESNENNSTIDHGNNTNRTREEEKLPVVIVKVRDPATKKCRALTYDPN